MTGWRQVMLKHGPQDGKWYQVKGGLEEIKVPIKPALMLKSDYDHGVRQGIIKARHLLYRRRSTEPEYQHVFEYMGTFDG